MERSERTARVWRCLSRSKAESFCLFVRPNQLLAGEKLLETGIAADRVPDEIDLQLLNGNVITDRHR
jgi:hypothetical protein